MSAAADQQPEQDDGAPRGAVGALWDRFWNATWGRVKHLLMVRALVNFFTDQMTDNAAALTYYSLQALFPGLLVIFAIFGLIGDTTVPERAVRSLVEAGASADVARVAGDVLDGMVRASGQALSVALVLSILLAVNGASGAFKAAGRAINRVFGWQEQRSFVRQRLVSLAATFVVILLYVITVGIIFLGNDWARSLFGDIGLGEQAADVWAIARWPTAVASAMLTVAVIYAVAPSRPDDAPRIRWLSLGAVVSVLLWLGATALFGVYVRNISHYGAVYGVAGALIVLLLFLYISNCAFLYGAELNAEIHRRRAARDAALAAQPAAVRTASEAPPAPPG